MELVDKKIEDIRRKIRWRPRKPILKQEEVQKELKYLQDKFVLLPIDKASNNIGFVCKQYYYEIINKEVSSSTYEKQMLTSEEIIQQLVEKCHNAGFRIPEEDKHLPLIYPSIKMHKDPIKFRYIIASSKCVIKSVAKNCQEYYS